MIKAKKSKLPRLEWLIIKIDIYHTFFQMSLFMRNINDLQLLLLLLQVWGKEMEMIHRLFLVIAMNCKASSPAVHEILQHC